MITTDNFDALPWQEVGDGFERKVIAAGQVTLALHRVWAHKKPNPHSHPHEQVSWQITGEFAFTIGGQPVHMKTGEVVTIPGGTVHTGRPVNCEHCLVLDVFHPRRTEYEASYREFLESREAQAA